jgi:penicillin amidase
MRTLGKVLGIFGIVVLVLAVIGISFGAWTVHRPFPQLSGEVQVPGLNASVEVIRDDLGIPQIYADNIDDLFYAQGYVHAQDRFWEMDFRRHITSGRLSEMFGDSQLETDKVIRTMGWRLVAEQEYEMLSDRSKQILQAYAKGVNAYIDDRSKPELSLEYSVLGLINSGYEVEPWNPVDSIAWLKALAWDLRGNMDSEIQRAVSAAEVGVKRTEELFPPYPYDRNRPIVETGAVVDGQFDQDANPSVPPAVAAAYLPASPALTATRAAFDQLEAVLGPVGEGIGSNSWAVSGSKTVTGKPLLANDPHLAPAMPSLWYQAGLHCRTVSPDCEYDVAGWTMSGLPGVFIGHNADIAWGFTNLGPDVTDLVLEKVDGDTYEIDGKRQPLTTREETIKVAGGEDVTITVRSTGNGPIMSDVLESTTAVGQDAPVPAPEQAQSSTQAPARGDGYAVALKWTALTPEPTFDAFDLINTAKGWDDFREAAALVAVPSQNLLYADTAGRIGYQAPGVIPIRKGYDGKWPVPGWTSEYAWTGTIPFEELPVITDPDEGYIVTANQAVIGPDYEYFLTDDWSYGARSQRIFDLIEQETSDEDLMTAQEMADIQMDARNELAAFLAPRLQEFAVDDTTQPALDLFEGWDFQQQRDSAPGAYFNAVWRQLVQRVFNDELDSSETYANGGDRYWEVMYTLWDEPDNPWWDDAATPETEGRDETVVAGLNAAAQELDDRLGGDPKAWKWGALHTLELRNASLGESGIGPVEWLFNRGPYEVGGGGSIVQATGWEPEEGYEVNWVPSMRQVVDMADLDNSTWVNLTGASGHAFDSTYRDQTEAWVTGEQYPWAFSRQAVQASARDTLILQPAP